MLAVWECLSPQKKVAAETKKEVIHNADWRKDYVTGRENRREKPVPTLSSPCFTLLPYEKQ
jgi:hypothetical protein